MARSGKKSEPNAKRSRIRSEADFKTLLCDELRAVGCYVVRTITGGMSTVGTPDLLVCFKGRFIGIEAKRDANSIVTPWQQRRLDEIAAAGGTAVIVHPGSVGQLMAFLARMASDA